MFERQKSARNSCPKCGKPVVRLAIRRSLIKFELDHSPGQVARFEELAFDDFQSKNIDSIGGRFGFDGNLE